MNHDQEPTELTLDQESHALNFTNALLFETPGGQRFTQDSPILPNVWLGYALKPFGQTELILTIHKEKKTGQAAREIREMTARLRQRLSTLPKNASAEDKALAAFQKKKKRIRITYIPGQIAVRLYFDELMRIALPLTSWWQQTYATLGKLQDRYNIEHANPGDWKIAYPQPDPGREKDLEDALMLMFEQIPGGTAGMDLAADYVEDDFKAVLTEKRARYIRRLPIDFTWLVRIAGLIAPCANQEKHMFHKTNAVAWSLERDFLNKRLYVISRDGRADRPKNLTLLTPRGVRRQLARGFLQIYRDWAPPAEQPNDYFIWRITKNRQVQLAVNKSALTVKADAARRLFDISCSNITWAVVDTGIDREHHAFKNTSPDNVEQRRREVLADRLRAFNDEAGKNAPAKGAKSAAKKKSGTGKKAKFAAPTEKPAEPPGLDDIHLELKDLGSRVVATYDFTRLRELLDLNILSGEGDTIQIRNKLIAELVRRARKADEFIDRIEAENDRRRSKDEAPLSEEKIKHRAWGFVNDRLGLIKNRIERGQDIDWEDLEPLITDSESMPPKNDHGTHVAGILGADWIDDSPLEANIPMPLRTRKMLGVCPDIKLIDVRVFSEQGASDEFELIAAIQYLRWLNSRAGFMKVHGANLSLSLIHEVRRYACGQTPICDECNESTALGMVMVAAAGNRGFEAEDLSNISASDSFRAVSITDPGNAQSVITVGATHRKRPHDYGVSYFSSRGPTGDGRLKPDIVAPGEKIKGPITGGSSEYKDGTSMAAPHVSGAAAMLMARNPELVGKPARIKEILCSTATDLGRDRYFQGCGLLDILRALQSI